jgi:hypothetical protein
MLKQLISLIKVWWDNLCPTAAKKTIVELRYRNPIDFVGSIDVDRYIMPCNIMNDNFDEPIFVIGDLLDVTHFGSILIPEARDRYLRYINYIPANNGLVSEQSVILNKMDEIANSSYSLEDKTKRRITEFRRLAQFPNLLRVRYTPLGKYGRDSEVFSDPHHGNNPINTDLDLIKNHVRKDAFSSPHPYPSELL